MLELLRESSYKGLRRILAITVPPCQITPEQALTVLKRGATDVMHWSDSPEVGAAIAARMERWQEIDDIIGSPMIQENLVGSSAVWINAMRQTVEAARFTEAPILLLGETGTGKELAARLIHALSGPSAGGQLITLDCTTIVPELSGSEFFGHERGAFTGAIGPRDGAFALASGGTLFLDEAGELPLSLQAQLLRVTQEKVFKRVGGNAWQQSHFRLICATNRDLAEEVQHGAFRCDLYYRIGSCICRLPPLRARRDDIIPLSKYFLRSIRQEQEIPEFDDVVTQYLVDRDYPGNVRELRQIIMQMSYRHAGGGPFTMGDLPEAERIIAPNDEWQESGLEEVIERAIQHGADLNEIGRAAKETAIRIAVQREDGNLQRAARSLGVTDRALQMRRARLAGTS